ncbi:MAG: AAA family ATPase [Granulosicoccus sp.]
MPDSANRASGLAGEGNYILTDDVKMAVEAAITLQRPLLVKGEPGTGKTELAHTIARQLNAPFYSWNIKSTTRAAQGLYEYDAVSRLRDSQLGDERVADIGNYIVKGVLWEAFENDGHSVVLIDEIDKADIEFPNDLLQELDKMSFDVYETRQTVTAKTRPLVIITSNNEKDLPDAFLRRCFFHYIDFPDRETMERIVEAHYPSIKQDLLDASLRIFFDLRDVPGLKKKPSTSELLDWIKLLIADDLPAEALKADEMRTVLPLMHGALLKNEQDIHLFERLIFLHMQRQRGGN